jgi:phosphoenolpyruvate carboxykinase (ATP)
MINEALNGNLIHVQYYEDPIFGFEVPKECAGVTSEILDPSKSWPSRDAYMRKYRQLALRFVDNFRKVQDGGLQELARAGPKLSVAEQTQASV